MLLRTFPCFIIDKLSQLIDQPDYYYLSLQQYVPPEEEGNFLVPSGVSLTFIDSCLLRRVFAGDSGLHNCAVIV